MPDKPAAPLAFAEVAPDLAGYTNDVLFGDSPGSGPDFPNATAA